MHATTCVVIIFVVSESFTLGKEKEKKRKRKNTRDLATWRRCEYLLTWRQAKITEKKKKEKVTLQLQHPIQHFYFLSM